MKFSEKFFSMVVTFEGFLPKASNKLDGVWTIGYGHTSGVRPGMVVSQEEAYNLLVDDAEYFERKINGLGLSLNQSQFDAVGVLCYNIGFNAFRSSTLCGVIRKSPTAALVGECWKKWVYCKGKVLRGLVIRREKEYKLYCSEYPSNGK